MQESPQNSSEPTAAAVPAVSSESTFAAVIASVVSDAAVDAAVNAHPAAAKGPAAPAVVEAPQLIEDAPAADLPSLDDLTEVAEEVQRIEAALPLLDKKNSPMCDACHQKFVAAQTEDRMSYLQCTHEVDAA